MSTDQKEITEQEVEEAVEKEAALFVEALDKVVIDLPDDYMVEIVAGQMLDAITSYHISVNQRRAFRNQGDDRRAEEVSKTAAAMRGLTALLQHEHPDATTIYRKLASARAASTRRQRETDA